MSHWLFPEEEKGYRKWARGTGELQYIDKHILNESKTRRILAYRNLTSAHKWKWKKKHKWIYQENEKVTLNQTK